MGIPLDWHPLQTMCKKQLSPGCAHSSTGHLLAQEGPFRLRLPAWGSTAAARRAWRVTAVQLLGLDAWLSSGCLGPAGRVTRLEAYQCSLAQLDVLVAQQFMQP